MSAPVGYFYRCAGCQGYVRLEDTYRTGAVVGKQYLYHYVNERACYGPFKRRRCECSCSCKQITGTSAACYWCTKGDHKGSGREP